MSDLVTDQFRYTKYGQLVGRDGEVIDANEYYAD